MAGPGPTNPNTPAASWIWPSRRGPQKKSAPAFDPASLARPPRGEHRAGLGIGARGELAVLGAVVLAREQAVVHQLATQRHVVAEHRLEPFNRAALVATAGATTDADGPDHLAVHHDRHAARIGEVAVLGHGAWRASRVVLELGVEHRRGHAALPRGFGLHERVCQRLTLKTFDVDGPGRNVLTT